VSAAKAFLTRAYATPYLTAQAKTFVEKLQSLLEALPPVTPAPAGAAGAPALEPNCEEMLIQLSPEIQLICTNLTGGKQKEAVVRSLYNVTVKDVMSLRRGPTNLCAVRRRWYQSLVNVLSGGLEEIRLHDVERINI
jgi:hypothetical protein